MNADAMMTSGYLSSEKKATKPLILDFFEFKPEHEIYLINKDKNFYLKCLYCSRTFSSSIKSTSNWNRHIRLEHPEIYINYKKVKKLAGPMSIKPLIFDYYDFKLSEHGSFLERDKRGEKFSLICLACSTSIKASVKDRGSWIKHIRCQHPHVYQEFSKKRIESGMTLSMINQSLHTSRGQDLQQSQQELDQPLSDDEDMSSLSFNISDNLNDIQDQIDYMEGNHNYDSNMLGEEKHKFDEQIFKLEEELLAEKTKNIEMSETIRKLKIELNVEKGNVAECKNEKLILARQNKVLKERLQQQQQQLHVVSTTSVSSSGTNSEQQKQMQHQQQQPQPKANAELNGLYIDEEQLNDNVQNYKAQIKRMEAKLKSYEDIIDENEIEIRQMRIKGRKYLRQIDEMNEQIEGLNKTIDYLRKQAQPVSSSLCLTSPRLLATTDHALMPNNSKAKEFNSGDSKSNEKSFNMDESQNDNVSHDISFLS